MNKRKGASPSMSFHTGLIVYYAIDNKGDSRINTYLPEIIPIVVGCQVLFVERVLANNIIQSVKIYINNSGRMCPENNTMMLADKVVGGKLLFWIDYQSGNKGMSYGSLVEWLKGKSQKLINYHLLSESGDK